MKTKLLIILIFSFVVLQMSAQDSYIKNRWNIKIAYQTRISENTLYLINPPFYQLGANYGVFNHLECGVNLAYSFTDFSANRLQYFANCNFHILPFFVDAEDFRLDFYAVANFGGITYFYGPSHMGQADGTSVYIPPHEIYKFYYGGGAGAAFYPFKHVGVYSEFTYEEYFLTKAWFLKYGLSVKF
jgi:hypothetical protein